MRTTSLPTPFGAPFGLHDAGRPSRRSVGSRRDVKARAIVGVVGGSLVCIVAIVVLLWGPLAQFAEAVALVLLAALATGVWMVACATARLCRIADGVSERYRLD